MVRQCPTPISDERPKGFKKVPLDIVRCVIPNPIDDDLLAHAKANTQFKNYV